VIVRRCHRFILGSLVLFLLASAADGATYLTTLRTPLYASPSAKSAWLAALPAGVAVEVSSCSKTWCSATWSGKQGWIAHRRAPAADTGTQTENGCPPLTPVPTAPRPEPRRNATTARTASPDTAAAPAPTTAVCGGGCSHWRLECEDERCQTASHVAGISGIAASTV